MSESGLAVHKVRLEPGRESTVLHSHLAESEWLYILQGTATLRLARPVVADEGDIRPPFGAELIEENREVSAGDFIGFREYSLSFGQCFDGGVVLDRSVFPMGGKGFPREIKEGREGERGKR